MNEQKLIIVIPFLNKYGYWDVLENGSIYRITADSYEEAAQFMLDDLLYENMVIL